MVFGTMTVEEVRHFNVTIDRGDNDWPDIPPYTTGCPLRVERLTFKIDVNATTGALMPDTTIEMHGRNMRRDGTLGKPAMRWYRADDPSYAWAARHIAPAMAAVIDGDWPGLVLVQD